MQTTGMTTPLCGYCGKPVINMGVYHGGIAYHPECTQGQNGKQTYGGIPITEERIRQIVREELGKA